MSNLLNLSPAEFCIATNACYEGRDWAVTYPTMADVWDNCQRVDWLLWIANKINQRPDDRTLRLFAVWCARNTPLADGRKTGDLLTDPRSLTALEVAERYANGQATEAELNVARDAAWDAARTAAWDAARTAACDAARTAACDAARTAAWDAARTAACDAANAAEADAWDAAWDAQAAHLRTLVPNPFKQKDK